MISYLHLKNFKSFSDILLDLRGPHGIPKKAALIYGENGAGKTNLIESLHFLQQSLRTMDVISAVKERVLTNEQHKIIINDDDLRKEKNMSVEERQKQFDSLLVTLPDIVSSYKMIGSDGNLSIEVGFFINGHSGVYYLECSENKILSEKMTFWMGSRTGLHFSISNERIKFSKKIFLDSAYNKELRNLIDKYWGKHSFLAILSSELANKNVSYVEKRIGNYLLDALRLLKIISFWQKSATMEIRSASFHFGLPGSLSSLVTGTRGIKQMEQWEKILNNIFIQCYSDIKKVYYVKNPINSTLYRYELHFEKLIDGRIIDVPWQQESSGTRKLLEMIPFLVASVNNVVCLDELDSGIHDILINDLIDSLLDNINGQLIATTHNTMLLDSLPASIIYIIQIDAMGNKRIDCVSDYRTRTQKTNSIRNKYLHGAYGGIPMPGFIDFSDISDILDENANK